MRSTESDDGARVFVREKCNKRHWPAKLRPGVGLASKNLKHKMLERQSQILPEFHGKEANHRKFLVVPFWRAIRSRMGLLKVRGNSSARRAMDGKSSLKIKQMNEFLKSFRSKIML